MAAINDCAVPYAWTEKFYDCKGIFYSYGQHAIPSGSQRSTKISRFITNGIAEQNRIIIRRQGNFSNQIEMEDTGERNHGKRWKICIIKAKLSCVRSFSNLWTRSRFRRGLE